MTVFRPARKDDLPALLALVAEEDGEAVRVAAARRGSGLGGELMRVAIEEARARGCTLVQLTTDLRRERARRFYERLGFRHSHAGMKLTL